MSLHRFALSPMAWGFIPRISVRAETVWKYCLISNDYQDEALLEHGVGKGEPTLQEIGMKMPSVDASQIEERPPKPPRMITLPPPEGDVAGPSHRPFISTKGKLSSPVHSDSDYEDSPLLTHLVNLGKGASS